MAVQNLVEEFYLQRASKLGKDIGIVAMLSGEGYNVFEYELQSQPVNATLMRKREFKRNGKESNYQELQKFVRALAGIEAVSYDPDSQVISCLALEQAVRNHVVLD